MSIISSLFNAGSSVIKTTAKGVLVVTRVGVVSMVTTTAAVAATVVDESQIGASQLRADPNINAGIEASKAGYAAGMAYARNKVATIEAAASDFETRHK